MRNSAACDTFCTFRAIPQPHPHAECSAPALCRFKVPPAPPGGPGQQNAGADCRAIRMRNFRIPRRTLNGVQYSIEHKPRPGLPMVHSVDCTHRQICLLNLVFVYICYYSVLSYPYTCIPVCRLGARQLCPAFLPYALCHPCCTITGFSTAACKTCVFLDNLVLA